jgi:hypothetical protein
MHDMDLSQGTIQYREEGSGRPIVLIHGWVATNCDSFEHFPPPSLRPVVAPLKLPGVAAAVGQLARSRRVRGLLSKMNLTMRPIPDELVRSWVEPLLDGRIRMDLRRFVGGMPATDLVAASESLRGFDRPALIAWGKRA